MRGQRPGVVGARLAERDSQNESKKRDRVCLIADSCGG